MALFDSDMKKGTKLRLKERGLEWNKNETNTNELWNAKGKQNEKCTIKQQRR